MELATYIDDLRYQLAVAAEAGGEDARALAERLTAPLEAATRLVLLNALSAAAAEITRELAPGSVEVRLRGLDPDFAVTSGAAFAPGADAAELADPTDPTDSTGSIAPVGVSHGPGGPGGPGRPSATASGAAFPGPPGPASADDGAMMAPGGATEFAPSDADDGAAARINLRVPARLKHRIEEAAARDSLSVNAWLVRALSSAVETDRGGRRSPRSVISGGQRITGWVR